MGRPRSKDSRTSFGLYGLTEEEDKLLIAKLKEKDLSAKKLVRFLLRSWLAVEVKK